MVRENHQIRLKYRSLIKPVDDNNVEKLKKQPNFYAKKALSHICVFHLQVDDLTCV
jgi:hypothetical protein